MAYSYQNNSCFSGNTCSVNAPTFYRLKCTTSNKCKKSNKCCKKVKSSKCCPRSCFQNAVVSALPNSTTTSIPACGGFAPVTNFSASSVTSNPFVSLTAGAVVGTQDILVLQTGTYSITAVVNVPTIATTTPLSVNLFLRSGGIINIPLTFGVNPIGCNQSFVGTLAAQALTAGNVLGVQLCSSAGPLATLPSTPVFIFFSRVA